MIDLIRLRQDAEHVLETHGESPAGRVALGVLQILANPTLACPGDYFIGRRPELLGVGVPSRP